MILAYYNTFKIWKSKIISIRTKVKVFNSYVNSVQLYACESVKQVK